MRRVKTKGGHSLDVLWMNERGRRSATTNWTGYDKERGWKRQMRRIRKEFG